MSSKIMRLLFIFLALSVSLTASVKDIVLNQVVFTSLNNWHYDPKDINNDYSKTAFNEYLERLDPSKQFFLQSDIDQLKIYEYSLDDELKSGTQQFFTLSNQIYQQRVRLVKSFYQRLIEQSFEFNERGYIELDRDKRSYSKSESELRDYWKKMIKYQVLTQYMGLLEIDEKDLNSNRKLSKYRKIDPELLKKAVSKARKNMDAFFERLLEEDMDDKRHVFLDSLLAIYDSHTSYFPPEKKEDFDISISGQLEGIGALLKNEDGYIKVVRIIPGSAAWRKKQLEAEDVILKVSEGEKEAVDVVGMRVRDVVKLIRGDKGTEVLLTIKKPTGRIEEISIVRDIVQIEETYAKSVLIQDNRSNSKFGYIYLPKFYRDFKNKKGRNSSSDVEKILREFKTSNIEGLVLDLRNNEGGALEDAVKMAGLFFNQGPVVQVRDRRDKTNVLRDSDKKIQYSGPMVVLMNTYSASASEIVAAALQDYKRAVIVGTESSFGKGTVQTFVNLDSVFPNKALEYGGLGSLKLTLQKFYRINGGSTQYKGVAPDIILPDEYSMVEVGEKYLDFSMPWDTIKPLSYNKWEIPYNTDFLQERSARRVSSDPAFALLKSHLDLIKKEREDTRYPLAYADALFKKIRIEKESTEYSDKQVVFSHLVFPDITNKSEEEKERLKLWYEDLQKDLHLNESLSILTDMISN